MRWDSPDARGEWYGDFARGVVDSYERLVHILDRLRMLTVNLEALCFALKYI